MKFEAGQKVLCILVGKDDQFLQISKCTVLSCLIPPENGGSGLYEVYTDAKNILKVFEGDLYKPKEAKLFLSKFVRNYEKLNKQNDK